MARLELRVVDLGRRDYRETLRLQRAVARWRRFAPPDHDLLLLVEHPPVLTVGRGAAAPDAAASGVGVSTGPTALPGAAADVVEIERGGDITYHGPGQLVGYPVLDLSAHRRDLHWYLRRLEEVLLRVAAECGLPAFRVQGYTGAWTGSPPRAALVRTDADGAGAGAADGDAGARGDGFPAVAGERADALIAEGALRKLASIGVHASRWITWHGFALNVTAEPLAAFGTITACGIPGVRMTSLAAEGVPLTLAEAGEAVLRAFPRAFPRLAPRRWPRLAPNPGTSEVHASTPQSLRVTPR